MREPEIEMGLLEQAREQKRIHEQEQQQHEEHSYNALIELALRDLNGETHSRDAIDLCEMLEDLGLSEQDYLEIREAIPRIMLLQERSEEAQKLKAETPVYRDRFHKIKKECEEKVKQAEKDFWRRSSAGSVINELRSSRRNLALRFPFLFEPCESKYDAVPVETIANANFRDDVSEVRQLAKQNAKAGTTEAPEPDTEAAPSPTSSPAKTTSKSEPQPLKAADLPTA